MCVLPLIWEHSQKHRLGVAHMFKPTLGGRYVGEDPGGGAGIRYQGGGERRGQEGGVERGRMSGKTPSGGAGTGRG